MTRWRVTAEAELYRDDWLDIRVADVELPDGNRLRHRIIKTPPYAGVVALGPGRRVLLLWRHRFITDSWGWEIPGGRVERGERAIDAAAREFREETGWRAAPLRPLLRLQPNNGITDARQEVFHADGATPAGPPSDPSESERVEWVPLADVPGLIAAGEIVSGTTMAALLYLMAAPERRPGCAFGEM
ncbi:NUDIX hydrolase [Actinomadura litoris]|uniref:NUDIX hydrolase n=1 Tax=Actinomadura litoris TaxID=2678616 RepID=UPI001FA6BF92|nr:NUDIX hydrolase [Actinomadura litoris]